MAWTHKEKKQLRLALKDVYRDYNSLKIFVAEELGWQLEDIVASGQRMTTVGFELLEWAEGKDALQNLYEAFREENPNHPFQRQTPTQPQPSKQPPVPTPESPPPTEIKQEHRNSGDNVAGDKYVYYTARSPVSPPAPTPPTEITQTDQSISPSPQPEPAPASKPPLPGEPFTFTTASVQCTRGFFGNKCTITKRQGKGRRRIFDLGGTPLEMVWIPAGDFLMGSPPSEGGGDEKPQHRVMFAEGFLMGRYPVTQAQWKWVAGLKSVDQELTANPSHFKGSNRPVEQVSWDDAQEFCRRLSQQRSQEFRLPSEAQWEYACRAGTTAPFAFGETLTMDLANYDSTYTYGNGPKGEYRRKTVDVGQFPANCWGLHDMHGNVWEWCGDTWRENYEGAPIDGNPWVDSKLTSSLVRGGSWLRNPWSCRSAFRGNFRRDGRDGTVGFRVVCSPQVCS